MGQMKMSSLDAFYTAYVSIIAVTALISFLMKVDWNSQEFTETLNVETD
ncbi:hypothetical protein [Lentibacillus amyloliquefaciens]|nr:hypothetical protein [Lentibacillus amyloliquefaciens]